MNQERKNETMKQTNKRTIIIEVSRKKEQKYKSNKEK